MTPAITQAQMGAWALTLPHDSAAAVLALRLHPGVEVYGDGAVLWLRGRSRDEALQRQLLGLPANARYDWLPDTGALRPLGLRLAAGRLPAEGWTTLRAWAAVQWPVATLPARMPAPVALRLAQSDRPRATNAWLGKLADFAGWTGTAPLVRLERLRFAVCADGRALVIGAPTPPIPGRVCVEEHGIVTPAGVDWEPRVSPAALRRAFGLGENAFLLWDNAGARVLPEELFIPVTRAAAKATVHQLEDGAS